MVQENQRRLIFSAVLLLLSVLPLSAQFGGGQTDSLVRLLNARYIEQVETDGRMARKAISATFLHNGTYMFCDSAIWNVSFNQLEAYQNVKLVQDKTVLTSDNLTYYANDNIARFTGKTGEPGHLLPARGRILTHVRVAARQHHYIPTVFPHEPAQGLHSGIKDTCHLVRYLHKYNYICMNYKGLTP